MWRSPLNSLSLPSRTPMCTMAQFPSSLRWATSWPRFARSPSSSVLCTQKIFPGLTRNGSSSQRRWLASSGASRGVEQLYSRNVPHCLVCLHTCSCRGAYLTINLKRRRLHIRQTLRRGNQFLIRCSLSARETRGSRSTKAAYVNPAVFRLLK